LYFWNSQGGQEDYTTVPDLRKGNASRCNIKRASPMDAPPSASQGGARVEGGGGARPPPSYAPAILSPYLCNLMM